jgi:formamidopyrimidine-DNA glycosylase
MPTQSRGHGTLRQTKHTKFSTPMPELPEVETMRRGILGIVGSRVTGVERARCMRKPILVEPALAKFRSEAVGATVRDIGRIGKRVVVHLDRPAAIVFEPRMSGLVLLADPPTREHLRFRITLAGGDATELLYWDRRGLGSVRLIPETLLAERYGASAIGPDALEITSEQLAARLKNSRRAIKVALLDQRAVAGIGNLYAAEILHLARIHPATRCDKIGPADWQRIHAATHEVLEAAIRYEGSTLSDGTYRNVLSRAGDYQKFHRVYDREGQKCLDCGRAVIERIVQAQRSTFFCPVCQRKTRCSSRVAVRKEIRKSRSRGAAETQRRRRKK